MKLRRTVICTWRWSETIRRIFTLLQPVLPNARNKGSHKVLKWACTLVLNNKGALMTPKLATTTHERSHVINEGMIARGVRYAMESLVVTELTNMVKLSLDYILRISFHILQSSSGLLVTIFVEQVNLNSMHKYYIVETSQSKSKNVSELM